MPPLGMAPPGGDPQDHKLASWRSKRVDADGWIDFRCEAEKIERLVRAVSEPFPGAYSYFSGERAIFANSRFAIGSDLKRKGVCGQVLARRQGMILIQTGDCPLWLSEPRFPQDRNVSVRLGDRFGFHLEDELASVRHRLEKLEKLFLK